MGKEKFLIINADDFGMCRAHNIATEELLLSGGVTGATVMAPCPYAKEAAEFAAAHPELAVGVHLTTTSEWQSYRWGAVADGVPSLLGEDGCFYRRSADFAARAVSSEVETELISQIERLSSWGLIPSHFDNHMGSLYGITNADFTLLRLAIDIAARYRVPFRFPSKISADTFTNGTLNVQIPEKEVMAVFENMLLYLHKCGVATVDYLRPGDFDAGKMTFSDFREYTFELFRSLEDGITETYIHPAVECDEIKTITPNWRRRVWEYELFGDPKTGDFIRSLGITTITYRDLPRLVGLN